MIQTTTTTRAPVVLMIISGDENNIALWRLAQASKESPLCLPAQVSLSPPPTNHLFATQSKIRSYWRGSGDGKYLTSVCASEVFCCLKMRAIFLSSSKCVLFYLFTAEKKTFREKNFFKRKNICSTLIRLHSGSCKFVIVIYFLYS